MLAIYNLAILAAFVLFLPYFVFRVLSERKHRIGLPQRLGFVPPRICGRRTGEPTIWVHSVSVGEVLAAAPLMEGIRNHFPGYRLLLSTTTVTGQKVCREQVAVDRDIVIYFPLDLPFAVRRVMSLFSPQVIILMETEIWPNLIRQATRRGIKLLLANGRLSDKSFRRYKSLGPFLRKLLQSFSHIGMQTEEGEQRMQELGAVPGVVSVMGSMKYEAALSSVPSEEEVEGLRDELRIGESRIIIAGSTHRGEERLLAKAFLRLKERYADLFLVLAPRHPERFREVGGLLRKTGIPYRLRSRRGGESPSRVMLLDTLGELTKFYGLGRLAFVGKSMTRRGGQNPLEPAACGKAVIFGRGMDNFREVADILVKEGGAIEVSGYSELVAALDALLSDDARASEMGRRARAAVQSRTGGVGRMIRELRAALGSKATAASGR